MIDTSLFFNIKEYEKDFRAESFIIGARGIGKTYSSLDYFYKKDELFIYMRNTKVQLDECMGDFGNPFKRLNKDKGYNIKIIKEKDHGVITDFSNEEKPKVIGYACDLSTFANLKGVDLSDVNYVYFDEFIEKRKLMFDQFDAFQKMYETVNRNRELLGEEPLKVILTSNSTSLNNPILLGYNLVPLIEGMIKTGQKKLKTEDKLILMPVSQISELKKDTAHYRNIKGTKAYKEAIENDFAYDSRYGIVKRKIIEYLPLVQIDDVYIYKHKSNGKFYACATQFTNAPVFTTKDNRMAFWRSYGRLLSLACANGSLEYSDFVIKTKLTDILM